MNDVTQILSQIEQGDPSAAEQLLPLVYDELRRLAAAKLSKEKPGQTIQATVLVHEAYMRLVDIDQAGGDTAVCRGGSDWWAVAASGNCSDSEKDPEKDQTL